MVRLVLTVDRMVTVRSVNNVLDKQLGSILISMGNRIFFVIRIFDIFLDK